MANECDKSDRFRLFETIEYVYCLCRWLTTASNAIGFDYSKRCCTRSLGRLANRCTKIDLLRLSETTEYMSPQGGY